MSFYSDFLAPEKHEDGRKPAVSDRSAILFCLVTVIAFVTLLIGGTRLLLG